MRRHRREEGAVAVVMALVVCFVLIPMAALAVDLGMQRVARRDMQSLADVVALDLSRQLSGGTLSSYSTAALQAVAEASLDRNAGTVGKAGNGKNAAVSFELGTTKDVDYGKSTYFTTITNPNGVPTAVRVAATTTIAFGLANALPMGGISSGGATRYAIATSQSSACFLLGSYAAALDTNDSALLSPLNKLLGLNLDLISYKGLAGANLTLADLAADTHIGTVDMLLSGNVTMGNFIAAAIVVLQKQNDPTNAVAISALQAIQASGGVNLSKKVDVLKMVSLQSTDSAALESDVNVLDLIAGAIQIANGEHAVDLSGLNIAGITGDVKVTQGIRRACGFPNDPGAVARASQIKANLTVPLTIPAGSNVLGLAVTGNLALSGGIGNAEGRLVGPPSIRCGAGTAADPDTYQVDVTGGLLGLGVGASVKMHGTVSTGLLAGVVDALLGTVVKLEFVNVEVTVGVGAPGTSAVANHVGLEVPQNAINTVPRGAPEKIGSGYGTLVAPTVTTTTTITGQIKMSTRLLLLGPVVDRTIDLSKGGSVGGLIATLLGSVNNAVATTVNNALAPVLNSVIAPLGKLLGVNVGGADVFSEFRPTCNGAKLAG